MSQDKDATVIRDPSRRAGGSPGDSGKERTLHCRWQPSGFMPQRSPERLQDVRTQEVSPS